MRTTAEKASRLIQAARNMAEKHSGGWTVRNAIEDIQLYVNEDNVYAEPGYVAEVVATGNWNAVDTYDAATRTRVLVSDLPKRLGDALERLGVECEWSDQWTTCGECGRLVRTQCDGYSWTPHYVYGDGDITCLECVDPEAHLESLQDQIEEHVPRTIDPTDHGYVSAFEDEDGVPHSSIVGFVDELRRKGVYSAIVRSGRWGFSVWILASDAARLDFAGTSKGHLLAVMAAHGACDPATEWVIGTVTTDAAEIVRSALGSPQGRQWADWLWSEMDDLVHPLPEWQAVYVEWLHAEEADEALDDRILDREELEAVGA